MTTSALQKQLYGVGIFEQDIVLSDFTDGPEKRFVVTSEQLMDFFRTEVFFRPFPGLVWMRSNGTGETYLLVLPAAERTILYHDPRADRKETDKGEIEAFKLSLPAIAVRADINVATRQIGEIGMWGLAGETLEADSELYELPLPNLNGSRLCLGATSRAAAGEDIRGAVELTIFDTPFNHHSSMVGGESIHFQEYVKKYGGLCPLNTLKPIGHGRELLGGAQ